MVILHQERLYQFMFRRWFLFFHKVETDKQAQAQLSKYEEGHRLVLRLRSRSKKGELSELYKKEMIRESIGSVGGETGGDGMSESSRERSATSRGCWRAVIRRCMEWRRCLSAGGIGTVLPCDKIIGSWPHQCYVATVDRHHYTSDRASYTSQDGLNLEVQDWAPHLFLFTRGSPSLAHYDSKPLVQ